MQGGKYLGKPAHNSTITQVNKHKGTQVHYFTRKLEHKYTSTKLHRLTSSKVIFLHMGYQGRTESHVCWRWKKGGFYCIFKVHKAIETLPSPIPIFSGINSITENIGTYVEHHISSIATEHSTHIQDTPDFLRIVEKINEESKLKANTLVFTMDAIGLYTNIKHTERLKSLEDKHKTREKKPAEQAAGQTLPDATPPVGKIRPFSKIAVTVTPKFTAI